MSDHTHTHSPSAGSRQEVGDDRDALTSPLLGSLYDTARVDAEWSTRAADEFTWWPDKLAQRVQVLPTPAGGPTLLLAATTLPDQIRDPGRADQPLPVSTHEPSTDTDQPRKQVP